MRQVTILAILVLICAIGVTFARGSEPAGGSPESDPPETTTPMEASPVGEGRSEKPTGDRDFRHDHDKRSHGPENAASAEDDMRGEVADVRSREGRGGEGREKVTVCHKGKKTLNIGASAGEAHARHGDAPGACKDRP